MPLLARVPSSCQSDHTLRAERRLTNRLLILVLHLLNKASLLRYAGLAVVGRDLWEGVRRSLKNESSQIKSLNTASGSVLRGWASLMYSLSCSLIVSSWTLRSSMVC